MAVLEETAAKLTPAEWQAVKVAARGADATRRDLEPGKGQEVDLLLRIKGTLDVGEDGTSTRTQAPRAVDVLAWVLSQGPVQGPVADFLLRSIRDAAAGNGGKLPEVEEGFVAQATMALAAVSPSTTVPRLGAVRGAVRVGVVNKAQLTAEVSVAVDRSTRLISLE